MTLKPCDKHPPPRGKLEAPPQNLWPTLHSSQDPLHCHSDSAPGSSTWMDSGWTVCLTFTFSFEERSPTLPLGLLAPTISTVLWPLPKEPGLEFQGGDHDEDQAI